MRLRSRQADILAMGPGGRKGQGQGHAGQPGGAPADRCSRRKRHLSPPAAAGARRRRRRRLVDSPAVSPAASPPQIPVSPQEAVKTMEEVDQPGTSAASAGVPPHVVSPAVTGMAEEQPGTSAAVSEGAPPPGILNELLERLERLERAFAILQAPRGPPAPWPEFWNDVLQRIERLEMWQAALTLRFNGLKKG